MKRLRFTWIWTSSLSRNVRTLSHLRLASNNRFSSLQGPDTAADVRAMIKAGRTFAESLTSGRGTIGALLSDDRLYKNLLTISQEVRFVAEDINAGKGSLGKLLKNDGVYNELQRMLESFRESGDIARENIVLGSLTSFTSLFFNVLN